MKDLIVKYLGPGVCYANVSINGKTYKFSDRFTLYNKILMNSQRNLLTRL